MSDYSWVGSAIQGLTSMMGEAKAQGLTQQQIDLLMQQYADAKGIPLPDLKNIVAEQMGPSASEGLTADPRLRSTEDDVLGELGNIYGSGGLDFRSRADINEAMGAANQQANSQMAGIRQQLQGTGQLGSGADIAMRMGAAQGAANRAGDAAFKTAALGEQRKMDALNARGTMASQMRGEDFNERAKAAAAHDAREQWNAESRARAGQYNAGLPQQQFQNRVTRLTGGFAPGSNLAAAYGNEAQGQRNLWSGLGAAGKYGWDAYGPRGGGGGSYQSDPNNLSQLSNNQYPTNYGGSDPNEWEGW